LVSSRAPEFSGPALPGENEGLGTWGAVNLAGSGPVTKEARKFFVMSRARLGSEALLSMTEDSFLYKIGIAQIPNTCYQTLKTRLGWKFLSSPGLPNTCCSDNRPVCGVPLQKLEFCTMHACAEQVRRCSCMPSCTYRPG
jgi:hypothetical protein